MKFLFTLFFSTVLFASLHTKSAMVYYGDNISYTMVGIHDYIIVQPNKINVHRHGFKLYKDKMYAYVSIGEIAKNIPEYKKVRHSWVLAKNRAWNSIVLDLKNVNYRNFLFKEMIEPQIARGFKNFFFDTLDSYQLASKTEHQRKENEKALVYFIKTFHKRYPQAKLIINRGFEVIDKVHDSVDAVLFESYYRGIGGPKLAYKKVNDQDREWLDIHINKIKSYNLDVICVDYIDNKHKSLAQNVANKIVAKGMIPFISNRDLNIYGTSSKNAIKREIFTLVDESVLGIMDQVDIVNSSTPLEYMGYIQKFHDINKGLPKIEEMLHYKGVVIWLTKDVKKTKIFIKWINALKEYGIKIAFFNNFGIKNDCNYLNSLDINTSTKILMPVQILKQDQIMGYEIMPSFAISREQIHPQNVKKLLAYKLDDGSTTVPAAFTSWGGYATGKGFISSIVDDNLWAINPYEFFKHVFQLQTLIVPDSTTENGKRLFFTHIDGDGIMNRVEGDFGYYSGDVILNKILKIYKVPHSVSVIGAEISPEGLFPKISPVLLKIAKDMYALDNVEPATHTFSHPFYWKKIHNDKLDKAYRLKPKGYHFSLKSELTDTLDFITNNLHPLHPTNTVFWSGDCSPQINALDYIYRHNILSINGGDTTITKLSPWLSKIAPSGIYIKGYAQIFTGAQNENVFTNDWLGPFWGFKLVTQTFQLTNSPKRYKPIDIYYHLYSGSKQASIQALEYVFDWAMKQDIMPIFTSEYIPKVMDYYEVSMANEGNDWLISGMKNLNTIRIERKNAGVDLNSSKTVAGIKQFENHTYLSLYNNAQEHFITTTPKQAEGTSYIISSNAKITSYTETNNGKEYRLKGHVALKADFHLADNCSIKIIPDARKKKQEGQIFSFHYRERKDAKAIISCK